jgi:carboxypeptidase Q
LTLYLHSVIFIYKKKDNLPPGEKLKKSLLVLFAVSILLSVSGSVYSQIDNARLEKYNTVADKFIKSALQDEKGYKLLKELCAMGPRLTGSDISLKAIYWAEKKMKEAGFDKVWLQKTMVPRWVRGKGEKAFIASGGRYKGKKLNIASLGGSIATPAKGITAEILEVKSLDELKGKKDIAKGKIVFFNKPVDRTLPDTFNGYSSAVDQRYTGPVLAAEAGAIGAIIRSVTTNSDNNPHTGGSGSKEGVQRIPVVAVGIQDADILAEALKQDAGLKVTMQTYCHTLPEVVSYNVIGELTGTELPNEVIVVGGHFDSWDLSVGAHDDGGPCMQAFEVPDLFKRNNIKPKRTVRCVFFINEENGLNGGIEYGKFAETSGEIHIAAIESDRGCFTPRGFLAQTDEASLKKMQSWTPVLNRSLIEWVKPGGGGSDIVPIKNAKAQIGYFPDNQRYMDLHHSANDTFASVHPRELELGSSAMAILVYLLSEEGL